jgi:hypothetical protein
MTGDVTIIPGSPGVTANLYTPVRAPYQPGGRGIAIDVQQRRRGESDGWTYGGYGGASLSVTVGGVPTESLTVPGPEQYRRPDGAAVPGRQRVPVPSGVGSGTAVVRVEGHRIGTVQVRTQSDGPSTPTPDAPGTDSGSSGASGDNSDPAPSTSPTPDPPGTDSGSSGGGSSGQSSIDSRTRAAVIAVMGVVAALIATR